MYFCRILLRIIKRRFKREAMGYFHLKIQLHRLMFDSDRTQHTLHPVKTFLGVIPLDRTEAVRRGRRLLVKFIRYNLTGV